jgi:hypothetical protein
MSGVYPYKKFLEHYNAAKETLDPLFQRKER